jgi:GNAT superfamily N-acetyltransferase
MADQRTHLRRARPEDVRAIAEIWRRGWHDGHYGHVPGGLAAVRQAESFQDRAAQRIGDTTVAVVDGEVAGFVMVVDDEVEQIYVARSHRGTGVAGLLLDETERQVGDMGHATAWLAVATGNTRARRFYESRGWNDGGAFDYSAASDGGPISVPCHRYTKDLPRAHRGPAAAPAPHQR